MPFLNRAGFQGDVEPFDFSVEGVTAISCDIVSGLLLGHRRTEKNRTDLISINTLSVQKVRPLKQKV
jgi:hypothetical protein